MGSISEWMHSIAYFAVFLLIILPLLMKERLRKPLAVVAFEIQRIVPPRAMDLSRFWSLVYWGIAASMFGVAVSCMSILTKFPMSPYVHAMAFTVFCGLYVALIVVSYFRIIQIVSGALYKYRASPYRQAFLIFCLGGAVVIGFSGYFMITDSVATYIKNFNDMVTSQCVSGGAFDELCFDKYEWLNDLYFSGITFTTLGYGDFIPINYAGRFGAIFEAFLGTFNIVFIFQVFMRYPWGRSAKPSD